MGSKSWTGLSGGLWSADSNWSPTGAPTSTDDAALTGPTNGTLVVRGPGSARSLTLVGKTTLSGSVQANSFAVGTSSAAGALSLSGGATLTAATATVLYGPLQASGAGTTLTVTGVLTLGGARATAYLHGDDSLTLAQGAAAQLGSLGLATAFGQVSVSVDGQSSLEIGTAGHAGVGQITVDAGASITGTGSLLATSGIVNQGIITGQAGGLTITGGVTGAGTLSIAAGGQIALLGRASLEDVVFAGAGGTLEVASIYEMFGGVLGFTLSEQGVIRGFAPGDTIYYFGSTPLSSVSYTAGTGGLGTLTLTSGTRIVGTLTLAGSFAGQSFQVTPHGTTGSDITVAAAPAVSGVASMGTSTPDVYFWTASGGGAWSLAANWQDLTSGANPAVTAPGVRNTVTLTGGTGTGYNVFVGPGNAAALTAIRNVSLSGAFSAGAVTVGSHRLGGGLSLGAGSSLDASSLSVLNGPVQVVGQGSRLTVSGTATLGGIGVADLVQASADLLSASVGAVVQVGHLLLAPSLIGNQVLVDAASSVEVGGVGGAALGRLTIDQGRSLTGIGTLTAAGGVLNQGTILATGGTLSIYGGVSGAGSMQIGADALLWLNGAVSTQGVTFVGVGGTLEVTPVSAGGGTVISEQGPITGFTRGDTIRYFGASPATSVTFRDSGNGSGVLTLYNGASSLGSMTLVGDYAGVTFTVAANGTLGSDVTTSAKRAADPLFDPVYYLAHNPDIAASGVDPYLQYMTEGWRQGRNPDAYFDTDYYEASNPDVAAAGFNPLQHFEAYGWKEGRSPSLLFSVTGYLQANPDVAAAGFNPLLHYVQYGQQEGRTVRLTGFDGNLGAATPLVMASYFDAQLGATLIPSGAAANAQAAELYAHGGWNAGLNPNAWFDTNYYLTQNPDVRTAGFDPLQHYASYGWKEGREPSLVFSGAKYLAANSDVATAGMNPLIHEILYGQNEGRPAFLSGGVEPADPLIDAAYYDKQLGAVLLPAGVAAAQQAAWSYDTVGWHKGFNPNALFDTDYYLQHNPDVAAAGMNPLYHFETYGWKEGRNPSAAFSTAKYLAAYSDVNAAGLDPLLHYVVNGRAEGRTAFTV